MIRIFFAAVCLLSLTACGGGDKDSTSSSSSSSISSAVAVTSSSKLSIQSSSSSKTSSIVGSSKTSVSSSVVSSSLRSSSVQSSQVSSTVVIQSSAASSLVSSQSSVKTSSSKSSSSSSSAAPAAFDIESVRVTNPSDGNPVKGDTIRFVITVKNTGGVTGSADIAPLITSVRFTDFTKVALPSINVTLTGAERKTVNLDVTPFVQDSATHKRYALGSSNYNIDSFKIKLGNADTSDTTFTGSTFTIATSNAVFVPVIYDQAYFTTMGYTKGVMEYMTSSYTRPSEVFTPNASMSTTGTYVSHAGGFDQMMNIRHMFDPIPGFAASNSAGGFCEQAGSYARTALGLTSDWRGPTSTNPGNHGYDYLIGLSQVMGGGATCGWLGIQVSGLFNFDLSLNRSQIIMVHESGHVFGAPHCDPSRGYVMCSGEVHDHYISQDLFVWLIDSRNTMRNLFD